MTAQVSLRLIRAYETSKKNPNYQLDFLLNSIDLDTCNAASKLVEEFKLLGDAHAITIDDNNVKRIQKFYGCCDNGLIEQLLWVALMFPEI